jgi:CubicO group peptidase (beta-lactamase class C family)
MQLVDRGAMHLDDRLAAYVPDAPHAGEVTLRELLMHTSGIPNYLDEAFADGRVKNPTTPGRIAASMAARALNFAPGTKYDYSNTGYVLLGLAVEHVAQMPLAEYERVHIFAPAGMRETTFAESRASDAGTAVGYMDAHAAPIAPYDASWMYADGDIVSTPSDVARFDIALMNGTLLAPSRFAEMRTAPIATGEDGVLYGLGQSLFPLGDLTFVGHHGGLPGFEADNEMLPQQRFAVVVCGNAFNFSTAGVNGPLLATLFPVTAAQAVKARAAALLVPGPGEDAAITDRFRTFFIALQKGRVDRTTVTAQMNAALGAEQLSTVAGQLSALGTLQKLIFRSKDEHPAGTVFHYTGVFDTQTTPLTFSLDASGKIAGVFLQ